MDYNFLLIKHPSALRATVGLLFCLFLNVNFRNPLGKKYELDLDMDCE